MIRILLLAGAASAFVGVAAGAFGAHGLEGRLGPEMLETYETAVRYQLYHALGMMVAAVAASRWPDPLWGWAGGAFVVGTVLFSGSLYLLAVTGLRWPGAVAPLGGSAFLAGWVLAAVAALRAG